MSKHTTPEPMFSSDSEVYFYTYVPRPGACPPARSLSLSQGLLSLCPSLGGRTHWLEGFLMFKWREREHTWSWVVLHTHTHTHTHAHVRDRSLPAGIFNNTGAVITLQGLGGDQKKQDRFLVRNLSDIVIRAGAVPDLANVNGLVKCHFASSDLLRSTLFSHNSPLTLGHCARNLVSVLACRCCWFATPAQYGKSTCHREGPRNKAQSQSPQAAGDAQEKGL